MTSPFAAAAPGLAELGLPVLPIRPDGKSPAVLRHGQWEEMVGWDKWGIRQPDPNMIEIWSTWPAANIGLALGAVAGVMAIDVDATDPAVVAAIAGALPPSPVKKMGAKGWTAFYRFNPRIPSRKWLVAKTPAVEILTTGRQTVLPPSIHPDTGRPYIWTTPDSLIDINPADLPELPDDLARRLEHVIAPFQTPEDRPAPRTVALDGDSWWREINNAALANLDVWVPVLLPGARKRGHGYRCVAHWRGVTNANVGINPEGIKDWGSDQGLTPIDLVMVADGVSLEDASMWLADSLGLRRPEIQLDMPAAPTGQVVPLRIVPPAPRAPRNQPTALTPFAQELDGLLGEIVDYIVNTAPSPQPLFALGAALTLLGTVAGRRFQTEDGFRTNSYIICLGNSGTGKEHPQRCIKELFARSGLSRLIAGSDFTTDTSVEEALQREPACIAIIDEFGDFLEAVSARNNQIKASVLTAFTKISTSGAEYIGKVFVGREAERISHPCLSIFGASTPQAFYGALQAAKLVSGALPRYLMLHTEDPYPLPRQAEKRQEQLDAIALKLSGIFSQPQGKGNIAGLVPEAPPDPRVVPASAEARQSFHELDMLVHAKCVADTESPFNGLWRRCGEIAKRYAMIKAIGRDPAEPRIEEDDADWAVGFVLAATEWAVRQTERNQADSPVEKNMKSLLNKISDAGPDGLTMSLLIQKTRAIDTRQRKDLLDSLVQSGEIVVQSFQQARGAPGTRYIATEHMEERHEATM